MFDIFTMEGLIHTLLFLPGILIALTFHEFAHAYSAYKLGDPTPKVQGRVSINPIAHIDPMGLIMLILVRFGWGKPVQINPLNFKHQRRDNLIVSLAGVTMNLIIAILFTLVLKIIDISNASFFSSSSGEIILIMILYTIRINIVLMVFNLLPIPPLDGFQVVTELFNLRDSEIMQNIYRYGPIILLLLIFTRTTSIIISPIINGIFSMLGSIFGLPLF